MKRERHEEIWMGGQLENSHNHLLLQTRRSQRIGRSLLAQLWNEKTRIWEKEVGWADQVN